MKKATLTVIVLAALVVSTAAQTIRRQEVINNAAGFQSLTWKMGPRNVQDQCYKPIWIKTPFAAGTTVTGMAYCWGCGHSVSAFKSGIAGDGKSGNRCTKLQGNPFGYIGNTFGVDCSGLVTRAMGRSEKHLGTSELEPYFSVFSDNVAMRMGDIFNKAGDHTAIFARQTSAGTPVIIEASATDWKVTERERPWSYFKNYKRLRYKQFQDGGLAKLNQGIGVNPPSVRRGQSMTVVFHLKELEGAAITYDTVTVAILDMSDRFIMDLPWWNNFKIPANGEKSYFADSPKLNLAPGKYKLVARGKIGSWFDFLTTGGGVNGKTFTVTK